MEQLSLPDLAARIPDGASIVTCKGEGPDMPTALVLEMIRRGVRDLHLVTLPACAQPASGMAVDMLIGAGALASVETSGISLGEVGPAPRFSAAVRAGFRVIDATCPAIYAAVQAGGKGQPFASLRGIIGSDLLRHRTDWAVIDNPFDAGDPVVVLKAIRPDLAILHARRADAEGNVWLGRMRDGLYAAHAAERTLVTVEEIVEGSFFEDEALAAGVLPAAYVEAIAHVPGGAWPMDASGRTDMAEVEAYARAAASAEGFAAWLSERLDPARAAQ